jgi:hypothetical protein
MIDYFQNLSLAPSTVEDVSIRFTGYVVIFKKPYPGSVLDDPGPGL